MMHTCRQCGKKFYIAWEEQYAYKRIDSRNHHATYFCRYSCMRTYDAEKEEKKVRKRMEEKTPTVKVNGPLKIETPEANSVQIVEVPEATKKEPPLLKPLTCNGMKVNGVQGQCGRWHLENVCWRDVENCWLEFRNDYGDELGITVEQWRLFLDEARKAAEIMGVML